MDTTNTVSELQCLHCTSHNKNSLRILTSWGKQREFCTYLVLFYASYLWHHLLILMKKLQLSITSFLHFRKHKMPHYDFQVWFSYKVYLFGYISITFFFVFEKKTRSPSITKMIVMIPSLKRNIPKQYQQEESNVLPNIFLSQ